MIKILILISVAALTTWIGVFLAASKKKRMQVFGEMYEFNEQLIMTLKYSRSSIDKVSAPFKFVPKILNGEKVLVGSDEEVLSNYVSSLGKSDAISQIDYLNEKKSVLKKLKDESFSDYKKYSSLYVKIFFLIGVVIAVLLA